MAERETARVEEEARRQQEGLRRQEVQRLAREKERAELRAQHERRRAGQAEHPATVEKPRWGTKEARREAMIELQRQIDKSRERSRGNQS
jgi:hypothetical protein